MRLDITIYFEQQLKMWGLWGGPERPPRQMQTQGAMQGNRDEAMTSDHINLYESWTPI